ncbi:MAG: tetratricopeptide repeat protein [Candidatus Omnitrophica bacterium]|nr:tetratricopeptide repeat protein [Candidatus Omnitrophota bacterium]
MLCLHLLLISVCFLCASSLHAEELSAFSKAAAAYHERRLDAALRYAKEAVGKDPQHVDAHILLGELYYLRQELPEAQKIWQRALTLAPSREDVRRRLEKLQREAPHEQSLTRNDTYPFIVRFSEKESSMDLGEMKLLLRETYRLVGQQFQYFPDHPITVILYPEDDFEKVKGFSHQVGGFYDGKIRLPLKSTASTGAGVKRVLWHEYTHALVHDLSKGRCPMWLSEGIATAQEARVQPVTTEDFKEACLQKKIIPWKRLWEEKEYEESSLKLHYEQAYLIVGYLIKAGGWTQMVKLLDRIGTGSPIEDALRVVYHRDAASLEADWLAWTRREFNL